jgi:hypothetical protein
VFIGLMLDWRMRTRIDRLNAISIDAIVSNHRARGIRSAAQALARNHVSPEVALRVPTRPWRRRVARSGIAVFGHRVPE